MIPDRLDYMGQRLEAYKVQRAQLQRFVEQVKTDVSKATMGDAEFLAKREQVADSYADGLDELATDLVKDVTLYANTELARIKALPQAPRAMVTELPEELGLHAVERDGTPVMSPDDLQNPASFPALMQRALSGDTGAQVELYKLSTGKKS